jgi:hypothetical protein
MILEGLLMINGVDVYTQYGAFLSEENAADHTNYDALLKPADMKPHVAVDFREDDGEQLPAVLLQRSQARNITLRFAILAANATAFMQKYAAFILFLKDGWLDVSVPELGHVFHVYFVSCSEYKQLTPIDTGNVAAWFKVEFREPEPYV